MKPTWILFLTLATAACATVPEAPLGSDAADPRASTPAVGYRATTAGYVSRRPVEPAPWAERNERVAPPAKP